MKKFGICHLSFFPLRKEANHRSENVSQVLFGEVFEILEEKYAEWFFVKLAFDGYLGWINTNELQYLSEKEFKKVNNEKKHYSSEAIAIGDSNERILHLGFGSYLPLWNGKNFYIGAKEFSLRGELLKADKNNKNLLESIAYKLLEIPYLWGGKSSFGFDCSGFTQSLFKIANINLPRDASQQAKIGKEINIEEAKVFDLAFFEENQKITHVGILLKDKKIIHASASVRIDDFDEKGIFNSQLKKYTHHLKLIKRIF
ncbi:MAG: C40 family peptidase [Bacteroidota bacterium]|nr:C40 family peptidase [Bacteroidota bacterium]